MTGNQNLLALLLRDIVVYTKTDKTKSQLNMTSEHAKVILQTVEWIMRI